MEDILVHLPWISSMAEFSSIIIPVLEMVNARRICEVGASAGSNSKILGQFLRQHHGELISIDPRPQTSFIEWARQSADVVKHIQEYSLAGIPLIDRTDAWFLDGDHNWYTVFNELKSIEAISVRNQYPLLIFLHDMNWPCARRDMYYDPASIPIEFLQPHSSEISITMGNPGIVENGFRGATWALKEGGPRNGILTAVEDFLQQATKQYHWIHVPAVLGLGVLIDKTHPKANEIFKYYQPYHKNPLIETLENDRVNKHLMAIALNERLIKMSKMLENLQKYCAVEEV